MSSIDDRICLYWQLLGQAQSLVDSTGRIYDKECASCGGTTRNWKPTEEVWVCGSCPGGVIWGYADVEIFKGEVQRSARPAEHENKIAGLAHFGFHLNRMLRDPYWKWSTQLLVGHALTSCSYADVAAHAEAFGWPTRGGAEWSEARARRDASLARKELRIRLSDTRPEKQPLEDAPTS